jgi:hypothetical protein
VQVGHIGDVTLVCVDPGDEAALGDQEQHQGWQHAHDTPAATRLLIGRPLALTYAVISVTASVVVSLLSSSGARKSPQLQATGWSRFCPIGHAS